MTSSSWAVIIAGGKDEMLNAETCTAFLNLNNKPILSYSLVAFEHCPEIDGIVIVAPKDRLEQVVSVIQLFGCHKVRKVVPGGATQYASFVAGMKYVDESVKVVVAHEASRPNIAAADISELIKYARRNDCMLSGHQLADASALVEKNGTITSQLDSGSVWEYSMPLAASMEWMQKAMAHVLKKKTKVKTVLEALQSVKAGLRLIKSTKFARQVSSIDQLRDLEIHKTQD